MHICFFELSDFGKVLFVMSWCEGNLARTSVLLVPFLPLHLYTLQCKFKNIEIEENERSVNIFLPDDNLITVYPRSQFIDNWYEYESEESAFKVYCKTGTAVSLQTLEVLLCILEQTDYNFMHITENYVEGDAYDLVEVCELLHKGVWANAGTLQRFLNRTIVKKRWNLALCFGKMRRIYQEHLEKYYAPGGGGYKLAESDFSNMRNSRVW